MGACPQEVTRPPVPVTCATERNSATELTDPAEDTDVQSTPESHLPTKLGTILTEIAARGISSVNSKSRWQFLPSLELAR